ncbi:MAG: hypothetical protein GYA18_07535 [Chloroflexi bacterium]|nr:hypothetical protein [Chloroflexota bacterium]
MKKRSVIFIVLFLILIFLGSTILISMGTKDIDSSLVFSLSITPTAYPLPTRTYKQATLLEKLTNIFSTLFHGPAMLTEPSNNDREIGKTDHFVLFARENDTDLSWFLAEVEHIYFYESSRIDTNLSEKINIIISVPEPGLCAPRGTTYFNETTTIFLFADPNTPKEQISAAFAHELGHAFIHSLYPNLTDTALNEGMATWLAEKFWVAWKMNSFDNEIRSFAKEQSYLPLYLNQDMTKAYEKTKECLQNRDILLTEFASFIDFLMREYGVDRLSSLFNVQQPEIIDSQRLVYPPNYQEVYGLELNQLEQKWLISILE